MARGRPVGLRRARARASAVTLCILATTVAGQPRALAAAGPLPPDLKIVLTGGGWGHGHGMSQYGARAQAEDGRSYRTILRSYYSGVDIVDGAQAAMRVLVDWGSAMIVGGPEHYIVKWAGGDRIRERTDANPYTRVRPTADGLAVYKGDAPDGPWTLVAQGSGRVRFYPDGAILPVAEGNRLNYYRGSVEAYRRSSKTVYTINRISMDEYLYGVVPREMPSSWHGSALNAQAVAARTYAAWKKTNAPDGQAYDICASTSCQVYMGYGYRSSPGASLTKLETSRTNEAIVVTSGVTMEDGGEPVFAEFHSSSGGHTSQGSRSYLAPVDDPWDETYSPHHRWDARIAVSAIEDRWPAIGRLVTIDDVDRDGDGAWGGRVESMRLVGTDSSATVSGNAFRSAFSWPGTSEGLRSTLFRIMIYDAAPAEGPAEVVLDAGDTATAAVRLRNTGTKSWRVGSSVAIGTWDPRGRDSAFEDRSWPAEDRASYVVRDLTDGGSWISPGETGEFRFTVRAPSDVSSGLYQESFRPLVVGTTWFGDRIRVPIRIRFGGAGHLGGNLLDNASFEAERDGLPDRWETKAAGTAAWDAGPSLDGGASVRVDGDGERRLYAIQTSGTGGAAGRSYEFGAWNRARGTSAGGGTIDARVRFHNTDGTISAVQLDFPKGAHGWTYRGKSVRAPKAFDSIDVALSARAQTGSVWFDAVRVAPNEVSNGSFASGSPVPDGWTLVGAAEGDGRDGTRTRDGIGSLRLRGADGVNVYARRIVSATARAGERWRLSGWNRTTGSSASGGPVRLWVKVRYADDTVDAHLIDFPRASHVWRYGEATFETERAVERFDVYAKFSDQAGTAWFDGVALAPAGDPPALTGNSGFELGDTKPADWKLVNAPADVISSTAANGDASLALPGRDAETVYASQRVPVAGLAGDRYRLSAWNRTSGTDAAGGAVETVARVRYADGSTGEHVVAFARGGHGWDREEISFTTARAYSRIDVYAKVEDQSGTALFDSARLVRVAVA